MVINKYLAELLGTFVLVFGGSMAILAVLSLDGGADPAKLIIIGFGFGLALLAGIWAVGHVSGAHFNPAVTLGMLLDGRISISDSIGYWVGQFSGAILASVVVAGASSTEAVANTMTTFTDQSTAILLESIFTAVFVWLILAVTKRGANHAPAAIALTLVAIHIAAIPFSGGSVNPARSFGPALIAGDLSTVWVYLVFPMVGAVVAWGLYRLFPVRAEA
ncbi:MAG TPA: MIP/aquaporin family protein [Acidimicrobiia bacterium]